MGKKRDDTGSNNSPQQRADGELADDDNAKLEQALKRDEHSHVVSNSVEKSRPK
jgi:hypothetical protein